MNNFVLSILIPTKNREEYAFQVIKQLLSIDSRDFQLVIQDNSDTDILQKKLDEQEPDFRLKYNYDNRVLSFVDNFSAGLERCDGTYVIILGDDDGVNPEIIQVAKWASEHNIDAITPSLPITYFWPESGVKVADNNGSLYINHFSCRIKNVNPKSVLIQFLKDGCHNYLAYNLAKAYHGLVKKSILDEIKSETGRYIGGLTPDIYMSVAISLKAKNLTVIDYPLTISGICRKSGSSDSATGKHTGNLRDAPHFVGQKAYVWSRLIPPFYSVETIWADSALAAIKDMKETDMIKYFNAKLLFVRSLKTYPEFRDVIVDHIRKMVENNAGFMNFNNLLISGRIQLLLKKPRQLMVRIINKISGKNKYKLFTGVKDISAASERSEMYIMNYRKKDIFL